MMYPLLFFFFFTEPFTGHSMVSKSCMVSLSIATQHRKKNSRMSRSTLTTSATVCLTESAGMRESSTTKSASKVPAATPKTRHYVNLVSQSQCFHVVLFLVGGLNVPIVSSNPHFLFAAEKYKNAVIGLNSSLSGLGTDVDIEPVCHSHLC